MGHIYSMPIDRGSFNRNSALMEVLFPVILIVIPSTLIFEFTFFDFDIFYILFVIFLMSADISLMVSVGRLMSTLTRNSILCFILVFGVFYSLNSLALYFNTGSFLWLLSGGIESLAVMQPSVYPVEMLTGIVLVSIIFYGVSFVMLGRLNLKNGR